ncbi:hypothetical protein Bca4012_014875 [Brassica carinata]
MASRATHLVVVVTMLVSAVAVASESNMLQDVCVADLSNEGQLYVGFVTTAGKLVAKYINKGEVFVFPKGLLHFQKNIAKSAPVSVIAAFDSQLPGTQSLVSSLFGALPEDILVKSF